MLFKIKYVMMFTIVFFMLASCGGGGGGSSTPAPGDDSGDVNPPAVIEVETVSKSITNATPTTTLENSAGVKVVIPNGAVPLANDGSDQPLVFSLEKKAADTNATLPDGFTAVGESWLVGPQNFVFASPISVGIPIDEATADSYTIFLLDAEADRWVPLPSIRKSDDGNGSSARRSLSLSDDYNWVVTRSLGHFRMAGSSRETLQSNPKKPGVLTLKNDYTVTKRYADYCILKNSSTLRFPDQHIEDFYHAGHGILGDGTTASFADNYLPQGQYTIQIGRTKGDTASSSEHRADCDGWFETTFDIEGVGEIYYERGTPHVSSDAVIHVNDANFANLPGGSGCAPCISEFPPPSAVYGVGNIGVTLNWFSRAADVDVSLTYPNGAETIYFSHRNSDDGKFELDLDRYCGNINEGDLTENIYSKAGETVDSGTYTVTVKLFSYCDEEEPPIKYSLRLVENGHIQTHTGTLNGKGDTDTYSMILRHE